MKLTFLGATETVTGSKYLLESDKARLLVDCGLFQGLKDLRLRNWERFPVDPKTIQAVVLTHAHVDHSGYLPRLVKLGFCGTVFCTPATKAVCEILLPDCGKLQEEEAQYANRKRYSKHHPALPLFTEEDAAKTLRLFKTIPYHNEFTPVPGLTFSFLPAGHILGSALVKVFDGRSHLLFTGDLGRPQDLILRPPEQVSEADYLVLESTYGGRSHPKTDVLDELQSKLSPALARNAVVIIPAFSVGRTQSLLYALSQLKAQRRLPDVPVYLNSPMSISATNLLCQFLKEHKLSQRECIQLCEVATYVQSVEDSKRLNQQTGPMIILSASGMATGGRVLHHLKAFAPDRKNLILLTGFQAAGTRGASILSGAKEVKMLGEMVPIRAEVQNIDGFSAHADQSEILGWLSHFKKAPKLTFITHGEPSGSAALMKEVERTLHWPCSLPQYQGSVYFQY